MDGYEHMLYTQHMPCHAMPHSQPNTISPTPHAKHSISNFYLLISKARISYCTSTYLVYVDKGNCTLAKYFGANTEHNRPF